MEETVFQNEFIRILKEGKVYTLQALAPGMGLGALEEVLAAQFPHVLVTGMVPVSQALREPPAEAVPLGIERTRVDIRVSEDGLSAWMTLWMPKDALDPANRAVLIREIAGALRQAGIVHGVRTEVLAGPLTVGEEQLIAQGTPPVPGEDAVITLYELAAPQPKAVEDGSVNHYEMSLINQVEAGAWLGERIDPTPGIPGKDVRGRMLAPVPGLQVPLRYERASVMETLEPGKTVLRARKTGAVFYRGDVLGVYDFLEVEGNVDYTTGNLDFDGFLSVKGTIDDNFSVAAEQDIEILGEYGVGGADEIVSRAGNIYIRGGIAGKGRAVIRCRKNLYVKFLSDVTVECEGSVYIGFYAINANIRAQQVLVESPRGRIVGGHVEAGIRIETAEAGNRNETRTELCVTGFDRHALMAAFDHVSREMEAGKRQMGTLKQQLRLFDSQSQTPEQQQEQSRLREALEELKERLHEVEFAYKALADHLRTPGEGAIVVRKRCHARVSLKIKDRFLEMKDEHPLASFVYRDGDLVEE
jgi:uncharacterized protein (DUF342 family)